MGKLYCSTSCATHVNNQNVVRSNNGHNATQSIRRSCLNCGIITGRPTFKFCSNQCQCDYSHNEYIKKWKEGKSKNTTKLLKHVFTYQYSSLREYTESKFKIVIPKPFPVYFKKINEHKEELLEWLSFNE